MGVLISAAAGNFLPNRAASERDLGVILIVLDIGIACFARRSVQGELPPTVPQSNTSPVSPGSLEGVKKICPPPTPLRRIGFRQLERTEVFFQRTEVDRNH